MSTHKEPMYTHKKAMVFEGARVGEGESQQPIAGQEFQQITVDVTHLLNSDVITTIHTLSTSGSKSQNPDELSIVENEQLEVIGEGDGDGWLRARNYRGEEGYVPHNYLDVDQESGTQQSGSSFQLVSQISFSSVDYTVDETDEAITEVEVGAMPSDEPSPQHHPGDNGASYCVALYDYEATCLEELMFTEGQVIRVLRKVVHDDVDDGWWEGELDGRTGLFPSLVVEECHADGEPITPQDDDDAPSSAPPVFTPPDIPSFMLAPQQVIITQATPMGEHPDSDKTTPVEKSSSPTSTEQAGFSMELSRGHYRHYDAQFGEDDVPTITVVEAPTICIDEDGEEGRVIADILFKQDVPSIQINLDQEAGGSSEGGDQQEPDFGLGVAQIVITAATPMVEEPEQPFPPPPTEEEQEQGGRETQRRRPFQRKSTTRLDDLPTDSAPFPISSSTGSEEDTYTGPSTAENSQSHPLPPPPDQEGYPGLGLEPREKEVGPELREKKAGPEPQKKEGAEPQEEEQIQTVMTRVEGGRGSIPDELEPHQLAQLQDLKESNA
uniref:(California timema) hypothetical protein n=1 Tax=Timema californicum TaxID=61474 RepID=A0A7R9J1S7_TIMCA|nr:unnamed protein product [Timema californicum]